MKYSLIFLIMLASCKLKQSVTLNDNVVISAHDYNDSVNKWLEKVYFEGQRDALDGDIRIHLNDDSIYMEQEPLE